jgi:FixJ family two-component response regulator
VAIVEDDSSLQRALAHLLRASRFTTDTFSDAESFLASARQSDVDCVILDVRLPGMSGIELQERLAAEGKHVPLVFVSAQEDGAVRDRALRAGAVAFLKKPVSGERLLRALDTALKAG